MAPMPSQEKEAQEIPAFAPVEPTHTRLFFVDAATVLGNSPPTSVGSPTMVSLVGWAGSMINMLTVFEPALTANKY